MSLSAFNQNLSYNQVFSRGNNPRYYDAEIYAKNYVIEKPSYDKVFSRKYNLEDPPSPKEILRTYRKVYIDLVQILEDYSIDLQKSMINVSDIENLWNERLLEIEKRNSDVELETPPSYDYVLMTYNQKKAVIQNKPDPSVPSFVHRSNTSYVGKKIPKNKYEVAFSKEFTTSEEKKELEIEKNVVEEIILLEEMIDRAIDSIQFYEDLVEKFNVYDSKNVENTKNEKDLVFMKKMFPDASDVPDPAFLYMAKNKE